MSIPLRFPAGSAARVLWATAFRLRVEVRAVLKRDPPEQTRTSRGIHSLPVILVSAIPGLGAAAYVFAKPLRQNRVVLSAALDQAFRLLPFGLYGRFHLRAITMDIARRNGDGGASIRQMLGRAPSGLWGLTARTRLLAAVLAANLVAFGSAAAFIMIAEGDTPFQEDSFIGIAMIALALMAGAAGILYYALFWRRAGGDQRPGAAGTLFWLGGGAALVWLAFDQFFGLRFFLIEDLDLPVIEHLGRLVYPGYFLTAIVFIRLFGYELESNDAVLALMALALASAAMVVGSEMLWDKGDDAAAIGQGAQLAAVAFVLPAFLIKLGELRGEAR